MNSLIKKRVIMPREAWMNNLQGKSMKVGIGMLCVLFSVAGYGAEPYELDKPAAATPQAVQEPVKAAPQDSGHYGDTIRPGPLVAPEGVEPRYSGEYYVPTQRHGISSDGYEEKYQTERE